MIDSKKEKRENALSTHFPFIKRAKKFKQQYLEAIAQADIQIFKLDDEEENSP